MQTADFKFELPPELVAQKPTAERDQSRLLVLNRSSGWIEHRNFAELLGFLAPGDVLVLNDSQVIPARLGGINAATGGRFEILLLEENRTNYWWAMVRPGKRAPVGTQISVVNTQGKTTGIRATVLETNNGGHRLLRFDGTEDILRAIQALGEIPLPPYIHREAVPCEIISPSADTYDDRTRYQTVFAKHAGSVAAPTAGLHFTELLLQKIRALGVQICFVTLHVGPGTFAPVKAQTLEDHNMHEERYQLSGEAARIVNEAKQSGKRVVAVGTTSMRVLESVAAHNDGQLVATSARTRIFIYPPYEFKIVDALLTNFHLPCSTLLMLVSAFAAPKKISGRVMVLEAYAQAVRERYRFFSYGDAMLIF